MGGELSKLLYKPPYPFSLVDPSPLGYVREEKPVSLKERGEVDLFGRFDTDSPHGPPELSLGRGVDLVHEGPLLVGQGENTLGQGEG